MSVLEIILLSLSLSVDTLVVSLGGSVSLGRVSPGKVLKVSLAMSGMETDDALSLTVAVFATTVLASVFGVSCGSLIGCRFGTPARITGGLVLIGIGIRLLF